MAELRVKILKSVGKKVKGFAIITTINCRMRHATYLPVLICLAFQGWGVLRASDVISFWNINYDCHCLHSDIYPLIYSATLGDSRLLPCPGRGSLLHPTSLRSEAQSTGSSQKRDKVTMVNRHPREVTTIILYLWKQNPTETIYYVLLKKSRQQKEVRIREEL